MEEEEGEDWGMREEEPQKRQIHSSTPTELQLEGAPLRRSIQR